MHVYYIHTQTFAHTNVCTHMHLQVNPNFQLANQNLSLALSEYGTLIKAQGRLHEAIAIYEQVCITYQLLHARLCVCVCVYVCMYIYIYIYIYSGSMIEVHECMYQAVAM
jgi:hypothetical protein